MKANLSGANLQHARNLTQRQLYGTFGKRLHGAAAININRGFAGEFIVHQGKRYRATLALNSVEQLADNAMIAQKFRDMGFSRVRVSGAGAMRRVEGVWPGNDSSAHMPHQIVAVARL